MTTKAKKTLYLLVLSFLLLQFVACQSGDSTPDSSSEALVTAGPTVLPGKQAHLEVNFSQAGGFYDNAFSLALSAESERIYYTTDGSDPRTSATSVLYTQEITIYDNTNEANVYSAVTDISLNSYTPPEFKIDKGIVIRAVAQASDGSYGPVLANSYFVGKNASYYSDIRVISMITDSDYLFNPNTGAYMVGSSYYAWADSDAYISYDPSDVQNPTNYNSDGRESEFPVTIQVFEDGSSVYTADVGARIAGNWSRSSHQKSFRFYAREEYGNTKMKYAFFEELTDYEGKLIGKFDKITLRNGGNDHVLHFRDAIIQDLASETAVDIMASEPYILFLNGEFWGFYLLREKPEDYYIQSHYGIDKENVTVIKNGGLESGTYGHYEQYRDFCNWAATTNMALDANYRRFCEQMDVQSFMDYIIIESYVSNSDWALGYLNNWMVWRSEINDPSLNKADGKWRFIFYDLDITAGLYGNTETSFYYDMLGNLNAPYNDFNFPDILRNLCNNEDFLEAFYQRYLSVIENCFSIDKVEAKLSEYTAAYKEATVATHYRYNNTWAADSYDDEAYNFLLFFQHRYVYAKHYLDVFCNRSDATSSVFGDTKVLNPSTWNYWGTADYWVDTETETFHAHTTELQPNSWDAQAATPKLTLEEGHIYRIALEASCNGIGNLKLCVNRYDGSGYPTIQIAELSLTEELTYYECTLIMSKATNNDWKLCFDFGNGTGNFIIKNVSISEQLLSSNE